MILNSVFFPSSRDERRARSAAGCPSPVCPATGRDPKGNALPCHAAAGIPGLQFENGSPRKCRLPGRPHLLDITLHLFHLVRAVAVSRERLIRGRYNSLCCGKGEGSVACFHLGDRTVTLFVFLAAAAWARIVPSDLRCLAILQCARVGWV